MRVRELIAELQAKCDPDEEVWIVPPGVEGEELAHQEDCFTIDRVMVLDDDCEQARYQARQIPNRNTNAPWLRVPFLIVVPNK